MCGIAVIFEYGRNAKADALELKRMRDSMSCRGPDDQGEWRGEEGFIAFAHRRLSIVDTSPAGRQPMKSRDGSLAITFNGEIYNHIELRKELEKKGRVFSSKSDTEVLLHLYEEKGEKMLEELCGMFAFAIWDKRKRGLFLARDPFGIKPLYFSDDGRTFRAASQVKALLASGALKKAPEPAGHAGFFLLGYVPEPYTLYGSIRSLAPGSYSWVSMDGGKKTGRYSSISEILARAEKEKPDFSAQESQGRLDSALRKSVKKHLLADVPVGVFLSSGIDSTVIAAIASEISAGVKTITLGFEEYAGTELDETGLASSVARACGLEHRTIWVRKKDFEEELSSLIQSMDQPSIDGVNSYFVSKAASIAGLKAAISGLGADEVFGGYHGFRQIPKLVRTLHSMQKLTFVGKAVRQAAYPLLKKFTSPKYAGLLEYGHSHAGAYLLRRSLFMPWELSEFLDQGLFNEGIEELDIISRFNRTSGAITDSRLKVAALELEWYLRNQLLRDADWAGMAHSVEIRTPFVDIGFFNDMAPLMASSRPGKAELAKAAKGKLLPEVLVRKKTGFSPPVRNWLLGKEKTAERGLRGWARFIHKKFMED